MRQGPLLITGALGLGLIFTVAACSDSTLPEGERIDVPSKSQSTTSTTPSAQDDVMFAASELTQVLDGRPEYGTTALDDTGSGLILYWHGEAPATELTTLAGKYPDVTVEVRTTDYLPGDLRVLATDVLNDESDAGVGAVAVRNDASGLNVSVHPDQVTETLDEIATRLSASTGVPVTVTPDAPVPAM